MKSCELCDLPARMYCDSDQANLCWGCDLKVHGANFLVARHVRTLLCQVCQSPTPWSASGARLGPTVSVCQKCSDDDVGRTQPEEIDCVEGEVSGGDVLDLDDDLDDESSDESEEEEEEEDEEDEDGEEEEEDDGENQVVPWSSSSSPAASSCVSDGNCSDLTNPRPSSFSLKRNRENSPDLFSQESISHTVNGGERHQESTTRGRDDSDPQSGEGTKRPLKDRRIGEPFTGKPVQDRTVSIKDTIEKDIASSHSTPAGIAGLLKLGRNSDAV